MGKSNEDDQHNDFSQMPAVRSWLEKHISEIGSQEMALLNVQRGYLFLLKHIHEEGQLVDHLCHVFESPLTDDEKKELREGKASSKKKELLKCLISKGETTCKEFLEKFKRYQNLYSEFKDAVMVVAGAVGIQPDAFLTQDKLDVYEELLMEEMEPTPMSDILFCHAVLSFNEHEEIYRIPNRRDKAMKLITKIKQQPDNIPVFCHALEESNCSRAIEYIKNSTSNGPYSFPAGINAVPCVRFNFRKNLKIFRDCRSKMSLLDYLKIKNCKVDITGELIPKESYLIKTGLQNGKLGCDCILEIIKQKNLELLMKLVKRLETRKKEGRANVDLKFNVSIMRNMMDFLLEELEPASVSNVLLEENAFSVSDHDEVENMTGRCNKAKALCGIILRDGSELSMKSFLYSLRKYQFILNEIRKRGTGQQSIAPSGPSQQQRPTDQSDDSDIQIRHIGPAPQSVQDIQASGLDVVLSIPVQVAGDVERFQQAVDQLNVDPNFQAEVAMITHMMVRSVSLGSVVLRLIALTDEACPRLFGENGKKMKTLIETILHFSGIKEDMMKGNIQVTVSVPEEETERSKLPREMTNDEMNVRVNWNLLVEELEPSDMTKKMFEMGVFNKDDLGTILSGKTRKEKVENLLNMLLFKQKESENVFDAFTRSLDELGKSNIAVKIKPSEKMHLHAEKVRLGLLSRFKDAVDEIESSHMEETLELCGINKHSLSFMSSESGKSRKDRALQFLTHVLMNDVYMLCLEKVLNNRSLTWLLEYPKDRDFTDVLLGAKHKRPPGEILYQCQFEVERKEKKFEDSPMTEEADITEMDWESSSDMKIQTDQDKPKHYEPKKRDKILEPKRRPMYQAQASASKKIFGRPGDEESKDSGEEWSVVVALDFGTTYSGYAFWRKDNPSEITPGKWDTGSKEVLESLKTPTSLLLNKENEVIEFGFEAEKIFKELAEDENDKEYRFFHHFKMKLHNKKSFNMDMEIEDHLNNPMKALEVFSLSIQYLKDECIEHLLEKKMIVHSDEIQWILTVPAIWDESAKQFMRKAAEQAEIPPEQLKLALEPEAAAIYVIKGAKTVFGKESVTTVEPGTKIMVSDLGGGTADMTVLELNEDKTMKQLHKSFGGEWGGNLINKKIWEIMGTIFGKEIMDEFKKLTADFLEMESNIELKKRDITAGSKLQLPILPSLADLCKKLKGKGYKELINDSKYNGIKVRTGKLCFEPDLVKEIFDLTLTNIYTSVEKVLRNPNIAGIKDIILVGGFAQADFIVGQFKEKLSGYNVIIPTDPVLAVLKGAVMFGQDINIISSRITAHTYGFDALRIFNEGDLRSKKRKIDNKFYCVDLFEKMVAIGDSVDVGKTVEKEVFASSKDMKSMSLKFYQSDNKNPKFVTDSDCECIGTLMVEMPDLTGGTERSVMVSISFGQTEINVWGVDKTTGKIQKTTLNLLGDAK